ncbi:MAG: methyltransferase domain-containing protein [Nitrospirae bacterium]|nr:methyltransferase domain-containing protein [Nitrospirota bacterium]
MELFCANASSLPFQDNQFDAVLHVGGINSFADKKKALSEMLRVVKPGGQVVINDEGLSPRREQQWYARLFIKTIFGLFASLERGETAPPVEALPDEAHDLKLEYIGNEYFWLIHFTKPEILTSN